MRALPRLQPISLAAGALLAYGALTSLGQVQWTKPQRHFEILRHPRDVVEIDRGSPYVVPLGKTFTLIGFTSTGANGIVEFYVDGEPAASAGIVAPYIVSAPGNLTVEAGSTIELLANSAARAFGYLTGS